MTLTAQSIIALFQLSFANPKEGAEKILALGIPREANWLIVAIVAVLSGLLSAVFQMVTPENPQPMFMMPSSPGGLVAISAATLLSMIFAVHLAGRAFSSQGSFDDCMVLICWWQFIWIIVQSASVLLIMMIPAIGALFFLIMGGYCLWLLVSFTDVIYRFNSPGKSALLLVLAFLGVVFTLGFVLSILGIVPNEGPQSA
ncbi:Yip1 family protein [Pseudaestuariivita rosea]|uniref:Yip1 family protein n=1 Tax=Pseudaestuariivita rosea TaxID=2763263 RepID=UPI001ABB13B1|nr:Yip1 family protein [Pseudaestuariivita rosea]